MDGPEKPRPLLRMVDFMAIFVRRWKLLLLGPLFVGLAVFAILSVIPKRYASTATLLLNDSSARVAEAFLRSPAVLDVVIAKHPDLPGDTITDKRRKLNENLRLSVTPGELRKFANLFYLQFEDQLPPRAQSVATLMIEQWIALSKPRPDAKIRLEADLKLTETRLKDADALFGRLIGEATSIVLPSSLQGELATSIDRLRGNRDGLIQHMRKLQLDLVGISNDVILTSPDLPSEHVWPRRGLMSVLSVLAALPALLAALLAQQFIRSLRSNPTWVSALDAKN